MSRYRSILLIYLGILYCFQNVLADVLDLQNILYSGFSVNNRTQNSCTITEVAPKDDKSITKVKDGDNVLWEFDDNSTCTGVILITKTDYNETLLYIELLKYRNYSVKYFTKKDGVFTENDKDTFNNKLSLMSDSSDNGFRSEHSNQESLEELYFNNEKQQNEESSEVQTRNYKEQQEYKNTEQDENYFGLITDFEGTDVFLNKKVSSFRNKPDYQCSRDDRECCNQRRVLDIYSPEENKRIKYEYEVNDGVPTLIVTSKKNKRVTIVYENQYEVWSGDGDGKLVLLSAHAFSFEYRLIELFYTKNKNTHNIFFIKINNEWKQINEDDFVNYYKKLKSNIKHIENISLNVSNVENPELFYEKYETNEKYKATTYFPLTGYHLTQVGDSDKLIWSSNTRRCTAAIVITENKNVRFLKLEILSNEDNTFNKFYKKVGNEYIKINENDFEQYINNEKPINFETETPLLEVEQPKPDVESKTQKENYLQTEQYLQDDYEPENINLDNFKIDFINEKQHKETSEQYVSTEIDYDGYEPTELDFNKMEHHNVSKGEYKNVKYNTIIPEDNKVFNLLKLKDNIIWQGNPNKYSDFVRVFYHENKPKLGFFRLIDNGNESDRYFVEDEGLWKFVTKDNFKQVFDIYSEYEDKKIAQKELNKSVQTGYSNDLQEEKGDINQEEQNEGPYRGNQPDTKVENSPLSFFLFDINDEDQALHS